MHGDRRAPWDSIYPSSRAMFGDIARTAIAAYHACIEEDEEKIPDMITPAQLRERADAFIAERDAAYIAKIFSDFEGWAKQQAEAGESSLEYRPPSQAAAQAVSDHFTARGFKVAISIGSNGYKLRVNW